MFREERQRGNDKASCHAGISVIIPKGNVKHVRNVGQPKGRGRTGCGAEWDGWRQTGGR